MHDSTAILPLITDPVVEQALISLTGCINGFVATLHPRDKMHVDRTLRILRLMGHYEEPETMRNWAVRNAWHPKAAHELAKLAAKIASLKRRPRLERPEDVERLYQYWTDKASESVS
ncbi:hypothetical protein [Cupriavidus agavae]|uniref:Uncharacterized protein n=1 Tax=Cupriavidus agavae TaxID=1001822 RepID=A0A4Q7S6M4_9BURK|nr:hypothetical protein [Cupriavidus agavae]RZT42026.1 hypothetical protein EV147_1042 [Cupriavidus agavae]